MTSAVHTDFHPLFHLILNVLRNCQLNEKSGHILANLDNWGLIAGSKEQAVMWVSLVLSHIQLLSFSVTFQKMSANHKSAGLLSWAGNMLSFQLWTFVRAHNSCTQFHLGHRMHCHIILQLFGMMVVEPDWCSIFQTNTWWFLKIGNIYWPIKLFLLDTQNINGFP